MITRCVASVTTMGRLSREEQVRFEEALADCLMRGWKTRIVLPSGKTLLKNGLLGSTIKVVRDLNEWRKDVTEKEILSEILG